MAKKLTTAERNRRKRERKKQVKATILEQTKALEAGQTKQESSKDGSIFEVDIEYVTDEPALVASTTMTDGKEVEQKPSNADADDSGSSIEAVLKRFHDRSAIQSAEVVTSDEQDDEAVDEDDLREDAEDPGGAMSRKKWRLMNRPTVGDLKQRVKRPDLVEAHDVTAPDPDFLIKLKSVPGTVPVPRHWGRKRKYLQGKRGIEKPPFQLPQFIVKTGITEIRGSVQEDQSKMSLKQKQRSRVAPKSGGDVDYRVLHDAFFRYQTKPPLTGFGELYYEGKEFEQSTNKYTPCVLSDELREALGMAEHAPPPWLVNMQRYGPPPAYPNLKIPGLNGPLPPGCSYGYHANGWGKPPVDVYGNPLYGGDPFGKLSVDGQNDGNGPNLITSDGNTISGAAWGALPTADLAEEEESSEEEDDVEDSSSEEEEEEEATPLEATDSAPVPPVPGAGIETPAVLDLRKAAGDETPIISGTPKQLYTVLEQTAADKSKQKGAVFSSDVAYVLPGQNDEPTMQGAESVLSKVAPKEVGDKRKRKSGDADEDANLEKKFKF